MRHLRAAGWRLAGAASRIAPEAARGTAIAAMAAAVRYGSPGRRAAIAANLVRLMPQASGAERERALARTFRALVRCNADLLRLPGLSAAEVLALVDLGDVAPVQEAFARGRGVVVVSPHLGNFELAASVCAALGYPAHTVVESIDPRRDAAMNSLRTAMGGRVVASRGAARAALRVLRGGGVLAMAGDRVLPGQHGLRVPFGGGYRTVPMGPAWLARQTGAALVTVYLVLSGEGVPPYQLVVEPEVPTSGTVEDVTREVAQRLSAAVTRYPDQWFAFQPDWLDALPDGC